MRLSVQEGEERTLDLTPDTVLRDAAPRRFLVVRVFTNEGVLLLCDVVLEGPDGPVPIRSTQYGRRSFGASPGEYTLRATHPGFKPHRQTVEIKPRDAGNGPARGYEVHVRLETEQ